LSGDGASYGTACRPVNERFRYSDDEGALPVALSGFPLRDTMTQFVVYDTTERPVATFMYSTF
jgi:hypothetical protein